MSTVRYKNCEGGNAFKEVDNKTYCLGRCDACFEDIVYISECLKCPRLLQNNVEKIEEFIESEGKK